MGFVFFLFLLACALVLFTNEILIGLLLSLWSPRRIPEGKWDVSVEAMRRSSALVARPKVFVLPPSLAHAKFVSIPSLFIGSHHFVAESLWESWTVQEREAALIWAHQAHAQHHLILRLIFPAEVRTIDRNALLLMQQPLHLIPMLEKAAMDAPTDRSFWATGLGLLGPSWWSAWPKLADRTAWISKFLSDALSDRA